MGGLVDPHVCCIQSNNAFWLWELQFIKGPRQLITPTRRIYSALSPRPAMSVRSYVCLSYIGWVQIIGAARAYRQWIRSHRQSAEYWTLIQAVLGSRTVARWRCHSDGCCVARTDRPNDCRRAYLFRRRREIGQYDWIDHARANDWNYILAFGRIILLHTRMRGRIQLIWTSHRWKTWETGLVGE